MPPKLESENMTYVEVKTIHGRQYKYLRKSIRNGKKVHHVTIKCLGPVTPIYKTGKTRKTNASIYTRSLESDEIIALNTATRSSNTFTRDRAKIVLLSSQGYYARQIAEKIGCEARKVRVAIKAFNQQRLKALERGKARGATPKFTKEQQTKILMIASTEPHRFGLHFTTWSLSKLRTYVIEQKIVDTISIESIRRLLKRERMKLRKSKRFQYSNDPDFAKKNS